MKLKEAIDKLGDLLARKKDLEKEEKEIKDRLKKAVKDGKLKVGEYSGNKYILKIIEHVSYDYDRDKIINEIGIENYVEVSKPDITAIKKNYGEKILAKAVKKEKVDYRINVKEA